MERQEGVLRMLSWLSSTPNLEKVARALILDYFSSYQATQSTIWHLNKEDALTCLAAFGGTTSLLGNSLPGNEWRTTHDANQFANQPPFKKSVTWSDGNQLAVINLHAQNLLIGFITIRFSTPVDDTATIDEEIENISAAISLYIALRFLDALESGPFSSAHQNGHTELTPRQHEVLTGITQKKTNNMIAKELGYSVSTIRHETMRIFEALGVSDRFEAAEYATKNGII
ncbi:MAG: LuxR C-terminal-related transcriptional regulator [Candidatus Nanopelagicaceae bacterium]|nr:LuxR C-terminal-related transcriptional regulator [Candidatus Nanopelagicaceae bacterium]